MLIIAFYLMMPSANLEELITRRYCLVYSTIIFLILIYLIVVVIVLVFVVICVLRLIVYHCHRVNPHLQLK
jgi:hypothetical protein